MHYLWFAVELSGLLGLGTTALWESFRLRKYFADAVGGGVGSDTYMFLIGVALLAVSVLHGIIEGHKLRKRSNDNTRSQSLPETRMRPLLVFAALGLYTIAIPTMGYITATLGFFAVAVWIAGVPSPWFAAGRVLGLTAAFVVIFKIALGMPFPQGLLW